MKRWIKVLGILITVTLITVVGSFPISASITKSAVNRMAESYDGVTPPTCTTQAATSLTVSKVGKGSATLNGTMTSLGTGDTKGVQCWFEWGLTTSYGNITAKKAITTLTTFTVTTPKTLNPSLIYHFRAATHFKDSVGGTTYGSDQILNFNTGNLVSLTAGENLTAFDVCYVKSDGKMWKALADDADTMPALFMASAAILADATGGFYTPNQIIINAAWTWTPANGEAALLFVSESSGGTLTVTPPSGAGDQIQIAGTILSATSIWFSACPVVIEIAGE